MDKVKVVIFVLLTTFVLSGCDSSNKKFKGKKIRLSTLAYYTIAGQKAQAIPFRGKSLDMDVAASKLYKAIRQRGLFYSGPLMLSLNGYPDYAKKAPYVGKMFFPVSDEVGKRAYTAKRIGVVPRLLKVAGGRYISLVYKGKIEYLEAGFIALQRKISEEGLETYGNPVLLFEDSFRELSKLRRIRILMKVKRK